MSQQQRGDGPGREATDAAEEIREEGERASRQIAPWLGTAVFVALIGFALYHYITAGTGIPVDYWHMGIHLSGVLMLVMILYPASRSRARPSGWFAPGGVPLTDWLMGIIGVLAALWIGISWNGLELTFFGEIYKLPEQALRQGDPAPVDVVDRKSVV